MSLRERLFAGVYPGGIVYADRTKEENGDYKRVAFLPYDTLKLRIDDHNSVLLPMVKEDAEHIIAKRGEQFSISACGQTVTLGKPC